MKLQLIKCLFIYLSSAYHFWWDLDGIESKKFQALEFQAFYFPLEKLAATELERFWLKRNETLSPGLHSADF